MIGGLLIKYKTVFLLEIILKIHLIPEVMLKTCQTLNAAIIITGCDHETPMLKHECSGITDWHQ